MTVKHRVHPFVAKLIERRRARRLSAEQLAVKIGITRTQIYRWERGGTLPALLNFIDWANALGFEIRMEGIGGAAGPVAGKAVGADPNGAHQKVGDDRG